MAGDAVAGGDEQSAALELGGFAAFGQNAGIDVGESTGEDGSDGCGKADGFLLGLECMMRSPVWV